MLSWLVSILGSVLLVLLGPVLIWFLTCSEVRDIRRRGEEERRWIRERGEEERRSIRERCEREREDIRTFQHHGISYR